MQVQLLLEAGAGADAAGAPPPLRQDPLSAFPLRGCSPSQGVVAAPSVVCTLGHWPKPTPPAPPLSDREGGRVGALEQLVTVVPGHQAVHRTLLYPLLHLLDLDRELPSEP